MNKIILLKQLIDIFYFAILIISSIVFLFFLYLAFFESNSALVVIDVNIREMSVLGFSIIILSLITFFLFIKSIFHIRKSITRISKNEVYHKEVSTQLKLAGWSIIIYAFVKSIGEAFKLYFDEGTITILVLDFKGFDSFWFILILGLFLQLIGQVLENARKLKLENDLTI